MPDMNTLTGDHYVLLSLASRSDGEDDLRYNRVALKAENISISTNKEVLAMPIPFSGITTGEATKAALDFGVATKTVSVSGIITSQTIYKIFDAADKTYQSSLSTSLLPDIQDNNNTFVNMGAHEVAQLIHSYVDSSFRQKQQNFDEIIILIRSKVNANYQYWNNDITPTSDIEDAELIPFTYGVRDGDGGKFDGRGWGVNSARSSTWPNTLDDANSDLSGIGGFIRTFSTTFIPGQPYVEFSLDFEQASNPLG